jgi:hypothetical protein
MNWFKKRQDPRSKVRGIPGNHPIPATCGACAKPQDWLIAVNQHLPAGR